MLRLNKATDETTAPILTRNISKGMSPLNVRIFRVKTIISQFYGSKSPNISQNCSE